MRRSVLAGVGAALLSWVLLCLSVMAWLSWTPSGHFVRGPSVMDRDSAILQKQYLDPFKLLDNARTGYRLAVIPAISIVTGLFVGFVSKARAGWIAVFAVTPLQIFLLDADRFGVAALARAFLYFLLSYLCASAVQRMRARAGPPRGVATTA